VRGLGNDVAKASAPIGKMVALYGEPVAFKFPLNIVFDFGQMARVGGRASLSDNALESCLQLSGLNFG
jgi:hypothetical protein